MTIWRCREGGVEVWGEGIWRCGEEAYGGVGREVWRCAEKAYGGVGRRHMEVWGGRLKAYNGS